MPYFTQLHHTSRILSKRETFFSYFLGMLFGLMFWPLPDNFRLNSCQFISSFIFLIIKFFEYQPSRLLSSLSTHSFQCIGFNSCITMIPPFNQVEHLARCSGFIFLKRTFALSYIAYNLHNSHLHRPHLVALTISVSFTQRTYANIQHSVLTTK